MKLLDRIKSRLAPQPRKVDNKKALKEDFLSTLPDTLKDAAQFLLYGNSTPEEKQIAEVVESYRSEIIATGKELHSFSSPHSGTFNKDDSGHAIPGSYQSNTAEAHAKTGTKMKGGILLRRIITGLAARRVLELGTNTGLSGSYILSCPQVEQFVTVEGSKDLCEVADRNFKQQSSGEYTIMNMLFDEAIDQLSQDGHKFDCIFIDGQHEREATWHYTNRVMPLLNDGGAIIFDDIYWSTDMNRFWQEICESTDFSITVDLQSKGVAILRSGEESKTSYDICEHINRPSISREAW